jgi:nicotinamide mononucleotide transporter
MYLRGVLPLAYLPAGLGAALFAYLCFKREIYAESFLQIVYVVLAFVGAFLSYDEVVSSVWSLNDHIGWLSMNVFGTLALGFCLQKWSNSKLPFIDAFTTVFSLGATWLMILNMPANWIYWIAINSVAIILYYKRGMKMGALMFFIYLLMAIDGYFENISWF